MKKLPIALVVLSLAGCGGNGGADLLKTALRDAAPTAPAGVSNPNPAPLALSDSNQFLAQAFQDGLSEIALGRRALQAGSNVGVREFAQRMITDHTRLNAQISALAQANNVPLPTTLAAAEQAVLTRLNGLTGEALDQAYMTQSTAGHERDAVAAQQQASRGTDADARILASNSLPILELHLGRSEEIQQNLDPMAFVADFYRNSVAEVQTAQLALQKSQAANVRNVADLIIRQHTQVNRQFETLAQQRGITLPQGLGPKQQENLAQLNQFVGPDFDKAFLDQTVIEHTTDIRKARLQSQNGRDSAVRTLAQVVAAAQATHLSSAADADLRTAASFLYDQYQQGAAELRADNLALLQSTSAPVRSFAQQATTDQRANNVQLIQLAQARNLPLPVASPPEALFRLVNLANSAGPEFDRQFATLSKDLRQTQADRLTDQAQNGTDPALRTFAQNALATQVMRSASANQLQQQLAGTTGKGGNTDGGSGNGTTASTGTTGTTGTTSSMGTTGTTSSTGSTGSTDTPVPTKR